MSGWTLNQIEEDFADLHGGVYENDIIEERRQTFREAIQKIRRDAWDEGWNAGDWGTVDDQGIVRNPYR